MTREALATENLEKYFPPTLTGWGALLQPFVRPTVCALGGVSLAVAPGEVLALIGANGAGQSTLLRILATLIVPTRGRAAVAGFDVEGEPGCARQQLGYHNVPLSLSVCPEPGTHAPLPQPGSYFALLLFAAILLPLSFAVFSWALRRTKITGTLTHS